MGRRAQGTDITLRGALLGKLVGGSSTGALRWLWRGAPFSTGALLSIMRDPLIGNSEIVERGLWKRGISVYGNSVRGTWRGAPLLGALKVIKGRLWGWASLFMGAQLGNLEWVHLLGTSRYG